MGEVVKYIYGTRPNFFLKTVRSVCVAQRQRFPKNGVNGSFRSVPRSVSLAGLFRFDSLPLQGFLATDANTINFA